MACRPTKLARSLSVADPPPMQRTYAPAYKPTSLSPNTLAHVSKLQFASVLHRPCSSYVAPRCQHSPAGQPCNSAPSAQWTSLLHSRQPLCMSDKLGQALPCTSSHTYLRKSCLHASQLARLQRHLTMQQLPRLAPCKPLPLTSCWHQSTSCTSLTFPHEEIGRAHV